MSPHKETDDDYIVSLQDSLANNVYVLSEISSRDKPWDKHRSNADKVADHYRGEDGLSQYADRMDFCSQLLDFKLTPDMNEGELKLKLSAARFCRVRHCPVCQWRRSLRWKAKAYEMLPLVVKDFPKHRWLFLTLTVRNCLITQLRQTLTWMNKAWQRLSQLKRFPAIGWIRSTEVTRGKDGSAHPHFHCLLLVEPNYFGKNYITHSDWGELWKKSLRIDYSPVLDIQAIKKGVQPMSLVPELLKYCVKESDLVTDREWFIELTRQLHKMRAIAVGGVLKQYFKSLEDDPVDLIGEGDDNLPDEGHMYFGWNKDKKKYISQK